MAHSASWGGIGRYGYQSVTSLTADGFSTSGSLTLNVSGVAVGDEVIVLFGASASGNTISPLSPTFSGGSVNLVSSAFPGGQPTGGAMAVAAVHATSTSFRASCPVPSGAEVDGVAYVLALAY
ncbi:MAG TPA: hypothetical protein VNH82_00365 [Candidatus Dormibacteraeota bacterium]|nr:hypothetical protein [Candidatus Dormibacteraeota bacterium]